MRWISAFIAAMPELRRFHNHLDVGHVYGSGNIIADAESRGRDDIINAVAKAWRIQYVRLTLPQRAVELGDAPTQGFRLATLLAVDLGAGLGAERLPCVGGVRA